MSPSLCWIFQPPNHFRIPAPPSKAIVRVGASAGVGRGMVWRARSYCLRWDGPCIAKVKNRVCWHGSRTTVSDLMEPFEYVKLTWNTGNTEAHSLIDFDLIIPVATDGPVIFAIAKLDAGPARGHTRAQEQLKFSNPAPNKT